jgi:AcrR family transcriptional regulator
MTASGQEFRRSDAVRNRRAIVESARILFAETADVPMCEVARHAGVGQATLYRNFPDRSALAGELLTDELLSTEALAEEHAGDPDAFFVLLRHIAETVARMHLIAELAAEDACVGSELERCRRRLGEVFAQPLRDAKAAGTVRRDATREDILLIIRLIKGAVEDAGGPSGRAAAASRALTLVLDGLAPSPRD